MMETGVKNKTIFDFTDDQDLINRVLGYKTTREEYEANALPAAIAIDLLEFAEQTSNKDLQGEIKAAFGSVLAAFFNE